jgi:hypothetical protein
MGDERIDELRIVCEELNIDFSALMSNKPLPNKNDLIPFFDNQDSTDSNLNELRFNPMIENYNKYITKLKLSLLSNCGFVNYDVQANNELIILIKKINDLSFTIQ